MQKKAKFSSPDPRGSGGWGFRPQTPIGLRRLEAPPPDPKISPPPHREFLPTRLVPFLVKTFFWSSPEFGEKKCSIFGEDLFFALHLICSPNKNCGRGSSPPMSKIGQNWGKIANYPPPMLNKDLHPCLLLRP